MRKVVLVFLFLLILAGMQPVKAQTDTEFWFAIPKLSQSHDWGRRKFFFRFATLTQPTTITISMPGTPGFTPMVFNVPANTALTVPLLSDPTNNYNSIADIIANGITEYIFQMWNEFPNIVYNRAVHITSTNLITAYFEVGTHNNPDIFSLKGRNSLGTDFFVPFQNVHFNQPLATRPYSGIYIAAVEDNTVVTITPTRPVFPGRPAGVPFDIVLQSGQSVGISPEDYNNAGQQAANHLGGTRVQSNKPIVVTTSDDSVRGSPGGCYDLIGDQLIPTSIIGTEYIAMKARLQANLNEGFYVTGTQPNTQVIIDGVLVALIGPGQMYRHTFTQQNHHIKTSEPSYVFHVGGWGCEQGGAVLPPINVCTGSTDVAFTRSKGEQFFLNIMVRAGAEDGFIFNGDGPNTVISATDFQTVPGTTDWLAAEFEFTEAEVPIGMARLVRNTKDVFHLAIINGGTTTGTMYGYFSDFNELAVRANISGAGSVIKACFGNPLQLIARGGVSFTWDPPDFLDNPLVAEPVALPDRNIKYTVTVSGACQMVDSAHVQILLADPVESIFTVEESVGCSPFDLEIVNESIGLSHYYWSMGDGTQYNYTSLNQPGAFNHVYRNQTDTVQLLELRLAGRNTFGCTDTLRTNITVYPEVEAKIHPNIISGCAPLEVDFRNLSNGAVAYEWNFGDGSTSTRDSLIHVFDNYSSQDTIYKVFLTAISAEGCIDIDSVEIYVKPYIKTGFNLDPPVHCNPYPIEITNTSYGVTQNIWSFDGGITRQNISELQFTRLLENNGTSPKVFDIWLYSENEFGCKDSINRPVTVYPPIKSNFTPSVLEGCNPLTVEFVNNSVGANNYLWDFDLTAGTSSEHSPVIVFDNPSLQDTAVFRVQLLTTSEFFCQDSSFVEIKVYPRISANFTIDYTSYCAPQEITFDNNSVGGLNHYWNFGTGSFITNNESQVVREFRNPGADEEVLPIQMVIQNASGCTDTLTRNVTIYPEIKADFSTVLAGCHPFETEFFNHSNGANTYNWDFGDGGNSQSEEPRRVFINNDNYSNQYYQVKLTALSQFGCVDSITKDILVYPKPFADYQTSVVSGCAPVAVNFLQSSLGAGMFYNWDFGDGSNPVINFGNASHLYNNPGDAVAIITTRLIAENAQGCRDTVERSLSIFPEIDAHFTLSDINGCHPLELGIVNASKGASASTSYIWSYGDGNQSTTDLISHDYTFNNFSHTTSKDYRIRLFTESVYGCKDSTDQVITVYPKPASGFQPSVTEGCSPLAVHFADSSIGTTKFQWLFGDGNYSTQNGSSSHIFNQAHDAGLGLFNIVQRVENDFGCWDTTAREIKVYPDITADFTADLEGCHPLEVNFENTSLGVLKHGWIMGDGTTTNTVDPAHIFYNESFTDIRTYVVTLNTESLYGCSAQRTRNVMVYPRPKSDFEADRYEGCSPLDISLNNLSVGGNGFLWDFGKGENTWVTQSQFGRTLRNLEEAPLVYSLKLVTSNDYGCSRESLQDVTVFPEVNADFTADNALMAGCSPLELNFENLSERGHTFRWNFNDGTYSTALDPSNIFYTGSSERSYYNIVLDVESVYGCSNTITKTAAVYPVPVADIFVTPFEQIYPNASITAENLSARGEWIYMWDMGDGNQVYTADPHDVNHEYVWSQDDYSEREYTVTLLVSNMYCHDAISQKVKILAPYPVVGFQPSAQGCPPLEVQFINESKYGIEFLWEFNDGSVSREEHPKHVFTEPGEYHVKLQVRGEGGLDYAFQTIKVFENPVADFRVSPSSVQIPYESARMVNLSSLGDFFEWHFGDGQVSYEYEPVHKYETAGNYDIKLIVSTNTDPQCFDEVMKSSAVKVEQPCKIIFPNAFTPNTTGPNGGRFVINDPANNVFYPVHTGLKDYTLEIYNRWGEFIFRSDDVNVGWDGYYRGKLSQMDVYVWKVWGSCFNGEEIKDAGDVTLYR